MHRSVAISSLVLSVLLASAAQLIFRYVMLGVDLDDTSLVSMMTNIVADLDATRFLMLIGGVLLYVVSMLSWVLALVRFDVSFAYPAMSISYVIVYVAAVNIPELMETSSPASLVGITLIVVGVILATRHPTARSDQAVRE